MPKTVKKSTTKATAKKATTKKKAATKVKKNKSPIVLVVEDDRFLSKAYAEKLKREKFEIMVAGDGDEAMNRLKENIPDVIILDIIMPKKGGFEFLEELRADKKYNSCKVIVVSNLSQEEDIVRAKSFGVEDFLVKTDLTLGDIVDKVREVIGK